MMIPATEWYRRRDAKFRNNRFDPPHLCLPLDPFHRRPGRASIRPPPPSLPQDIHNK
ncbi:hypothetical protein LguiA_007619 [Lonicera macranthoides]